jgi:hypothetical protein
MKGGTDRRAGDLEQRRQGLRIEGQYDATWLGIVPPVLRTPTGPRQGPIQNGPDRPNKKERHAANERSSIKELEAMQESTISLNGIKRKEAVRKKERNLELYITI